MFVFSIHFFKAGTGTIMITDFNKILRYCAAAILLVLAAGRPAFSGPIYASNGLGLVVRDDIGWSRAMGGSGVADIYRKNMIRENPALLTTFGIHTYSLGATHERNTAFTGGSESPAFAKTQADVFKIVIPLFKGGVVGWTMSPLTKTDSIIRYSTTDYVDEVEFIGGINMSSFGLAWSIKDFVRIGASLNYHFGMIEEKWTRSFTDTDFYGSTDSIKKKYSGYGLSLGTVVRVMKNTNVGVSFTPQANLDTVIRVRPGSTSSPERNQKTFTTTLPERWRFGVSSLVTRRIVVNADFMLANWEDAARTKVEKEMYNDTYSVGAGVRLNPVTTPGATLLQRIPVSAGFRMGSMYFKSYPTIDTVYEKAGTLGFEFPVKENTASLVTSFEFGVRGDKSKNGWEENFTSIGIVLIGTIK